MNPTTLDRLLDGLRAHLAGHEVPVPVSVRLDLLGPAIDVQVDHGALLAQVRGLLAWGHSLHQVTAIWWRTREDSLHVTVTGTTAAGVRVRAFTGLDYARVAHLVNLAPDDRASVTLDELGVLLGALAHTRAGAA